jgi:anti-anti-sigma factor
VRGNQIRLFCVYLTETAAGRRQMGGAMNVSPTADGLVLTGSLDARSVAVVRTALARTLDEVPFGDVVLDVSGVDSVDATGLAVLAAAHRRAHQEGRQLVLRGCHGSLRRVLAKTKLTRVLRLEPAEVSV